MVASFFVLTEHLPGTWASGCAEAVGKPLYLGFGELGKKLCVPQPDTPGETS